MMQQNKTNVSREKLKIMTSQENTLPEKCCAKCGFLYGITSEATYSSDELFDPDALRTCPRATCMAWQ